MLNNKLIIGVGSLVAVTVVAGAFLSSVNAFADDSVVDEINITVPTSCSLEGTGMTSHNANIVNGTYQGDIGSTTLKAFCNDADGFAIYAIGYTDNEYGKTVLTNTTLGSTHDIVTGTATSGNTSNWAMKLATVTNPTPTYPITLDNSFNAYHNVPSSYTKVAHRDSGTDIGTNATGASLTSTYAAFMSQTQPAGTYTGQVKYTLVHPASEEPLQPQPARAGYIVYHPNASTVVGQMGDQSASNNAEIRLWAPNFKRDGYGFAGWNDKFDYSGNFYGPNETITTPSDVSTNGLSLYAVWIPSVSDMQGWSGCSGLTSGATTALTDLRDGNTYAVAKLADNKCWMIENLRIADKDSSNNDIILNSANTHNPSLPLINSWWFSTDNDNDTIPTSNHLSPTTDPTSTDWCIVGASNCDDQSMLATNNTTLFTNNTSSNYSVTSNVYGYGNYYNWYSATVGHGKNGTDYGSNYHAPGDICPIGWRLPKGGNKSQESTSDFWQLIVTSINNGVSPANYDSESYPFYSGTAEAAPVSNALRAYPNNFINSGYVNRSVSSRSYNGDYWSASGQNNKSAYSLYFHVNGYVFPGTDGGDKYFGKAIRCVAGV